MSLFWLLLGLIPLTILGWMGLRVLEWTHPVLRPIERWAIGAMLGPTMMSYVQFLLAWVAHIPLSRTGFLMGQALLLLALGLPLFRLWKHRQMQSASVALPTERMPKALAILLGILLLWSGVRLVAMSSLAFTVPTYFDDAVENWNFRGKIFFTEKKIDLVVPPSTEPGGISSYPPSVPIIKAWLSALPGYWDEGIVNGMHLLWLFGSLLLLYCAVRRRASRGWALLGVYLLSSLPLYLMHGTNAYADVFLGAHLFAAVWLLFEAAHANNRGSAMSFVRLFCLPFALMSFTKNEGLILYTPALFAVALVTLILLWKKSILSTKDMAKAGLWVVASLIVAVPWVGFKIANNLDFGNAKGVSGFSFAWQKGVVIAILVNTFFEGNWLLLFPLLLLLLVFGRKYAFHGSLLIINLAFLIPYCVQLFLYLFTSLSTEAILQTGYARGLIHLVPIVVLLATLLLRELVTKNVEGRV